MADNAMTARLVAIGHGALFIELGARYCGMMRFPDTRRAPVMSLGRHGVIIRFYATRTCTHIDTCHDMIHVQSIYNVTIMFFFVITV